MNYYLDTEFIEGTQSKQVPFLNFKYGETKFTIDLISIGIVAEDGREYYAISKDFNLKEAWNRFQYKERTNVERANGFEPRKEYWVRENVLHQIHYDLWQIENSFKLSFEEWKEKTCKGFYKGRKHYRSLKRLLKKYGKSNEQIAKEVKDFSTMYPAKNGVGLQLDDNINFYAYYGDYDWVVFCWLFGRMINLPKGFPMYCKDLKQILDERAGNWTGMIEQQSNIFNDTLESKINSIKSCKDYPKQTNEHNALADAKWNKRLHEFLNKI